MNDIAIHYPLPGTCILITASLSLGSVPPTFQVSEILRYFPFLL